jgi:hypothetical protein
MSVGRVAGNGINDGHGSAHFTAKRECGSGIRDAGSGIRDAGSGMRDPRDSRLANRESASAEATADRPRTARAFDIAPD